MVLYQLLEYQVQYYSIQLGVSQML